MVYSGKDHKGIGIFIFLICFLFWVQKLWIEIDEEGKKPLPAASWEDRNRLEHEMRKPWLIFCSLFSFIKVDGFFRKNKVENHTKGIPEAKKAKRKEN